MSHLPTEERRMDMAFKGGRDRRLRLDKDECFTLKPPNSYTGYSTLIRSDGRRARLYPKTRAAILGVSSPISDTPIIPAKIGTPDHPDPHKGMIYNPYTDRWSWV